MTGKERLQLILDGQIPDRPPHWELVFQLEKAMLGMDPDAVAEADRPDFQLDVYHRTPNHDAGPLEGLRWGLCHTTAQNTGFIQRFEVDENLKNFYMTKATYE